MSYRFLRMPASLFLLFSLTSGLFSQGKGSGSSVKVPAGMPIYVQLNGTYPMRAGQIVQAHVSYPVWADGQIAIPVGSVVTGHVSYLQPAKRERQAARWNGDFTPFHLAEVVFDQILLADGRTLRVDTVNADQGVQTLTIASASSSHHSMIQIQLEAMRNEAKNSVHVFTGPDKAERLKRALWHQLPWHPESLTKGSEWSFALVTPTWIPATITEPALSASGEKLKGLRTLRAHLSRPISSKTDKQGAAVTAVVLEPLYAEDQSIEVPQGSILEGTITEAKAARWFGRDGKLRFAFKTVRYPEGSVQAIAGTPNATATDAEHPLTMDAEGGVKPASKDRLLRPLLSVYLANSALDQEASSTGVNAAASNSFGMIGRTLGAAAGSPSVAAGIGYYTAAREVSVSWIARGRDVDFAQNTRIEIAVQPRAGTTLPTKTQ
jgi:hypothetical protein